MIRTIIEFIVGIIIFMLGATLGMLATCLVVASKERENDYERSKGMAKDLIDRQTLLAQMEAQEQAYRIDIQDGKTDLVEPSWDLAIAMVKDMPEVN